MLVALLHFSAATAAAATIVAAAAVAATGSHRGEYCRTSAGNIHASIYGTLMFLNHRGEYCTASAGIIHASYLCHIHASFIHISSLSG